MIIDTAHHAYIISGSVATLRENLLAEIEQAFDFTYKGNPDYFFWQTDSLSIDDSRRLQQWAAQKAVGDRQIILVGFDTATTEAQNALLKLLEEPTPHTHFFLVTPQPSALLPTLLSRVSSLSIDVPQLPNSSVSAATFLQASVAERIELVKPIIENKDAQAASQLLETIEQSLHGRFQAGERDLASALHELLSLRVYFKARGSSLKSLLEHMAVIV